MWMGWTSKEVEDTYSNITTTYAAIEADNMLTVLCLVVYLDADLLCDFFNRSFSQSSYGSERISSQCQWYNATIDYYYTSMAIFLESFQQLALVVSDSKGT